MTKESSLIFSEDKLKPVLDQDLEIRVGGGGVVSPKNCFWSKNKGGAPDPSTGSATENT